ncbi:transcriptional regulator PpsR [Bradyrhizobium sp.]|uniref:transcriptional regulator PpsR n=1 Tax=Bradyrhizobium sp. TaxID=376 RepID=UPI003C29761E
MQVFKSPKESLGDLGALSAAKLIAAATDVALVVDRLGLIRDVAFNKEDLSLELDAQGRWMGSKLAEIVTPDTKAKVGELLQDAVVRKSSSWRQVNHPSAGGEDIPVLYAAINIGRDDRFVVVGRDLRPLAAMQQRLINAQQSMERDYVRLRHAETRYRLLFQVSSEAVMIVDTVSNAIIDANPAALALFDQSAPQLLKSGFPGHFDAAGSQAIQTLLADVRATGRDSSARAHLADGQRECSIRVSLFRQENAALFLVRLASHASPPEGSTLKATSMLLKYFDAAPDGLVITQFDGRIVRANPAFLEMAQLSSAEQARGELLDRWLGRAGVDFSVALANLRQNDSIKLFATAMRGEYGVTTDVEVSAVSIADGDDKPSFGFAVRNVEKRLSSSSSSRELPRSMAQLIELIGRVPLRDLVRETTDVIEKLSIEAALELTGDNRASAAEMLGLSRQSLYVKLRRFGLAEHATDGEAEDE